MTKEFVSTENMQHPTWSLQTYRL